VDFINSTMRRTLSSPLIAIGVDPEPDLAFDVARFADEDERGRNRFCQL
jgi:hypothetical protein